MGWGLLLNSLALAAPVALAAVAVGWLVALFIAASRGLLRWAARVGAVVAALREHFDALLVEKAERPRLDVLGSAVVGAILRLLLHDGLA